MPSTHSPAGNLMIVASPAAANTIARDPGRGFHGGTAGPRVARQTTGR